MIMSYLQKECPAKRYHEDNNQACELLSKAGHFFQELVRLGVWPLSRIVHQTNLSTMSNQLLHFRNYISDMPGTSDDKDTDTNFSHRRCRNNRIDFKSKLEVAVEDAFQLQEGLCLRCVKQGKVTRDEGNCRNTLEHLCVS